MQILSPPAKSFWHFGRLFFFLVDLALFSVSVVIAFRLSPSVPDSWVLNAQHSASYFKVLLLPPCLALGLQLSDVQKLQAHFRKSETLVRIAFGSALGALGFVVLHALINFQLVGRYIILFSWSTGVILTFISRMLLFRLARMKPRTLLFWGTEADAQAFSEQLTRANLPIFLVGRYEKGQLFPAHGLRSIFESPIPLKVEVDFQTPLPPEHPFDSQVHIAVAKLSDMCLRLRVESIILAEPKELNVDEKRKLTQLISKGVKVRTLNDVFERELERVHVSSMNDAWLWDHDAAVNTAFFIAAKRLVDISLSLVASLIVFPFIPIVSFLIWIQDRGPVFYSQERTGLFGEQFRIYKFRTMRVNAETDGVQWAQQNDQRVTWIGRLLRKSRFDEVPQFFNILKGDMSFVGPRPEREELISEIEQELPYFRFRHLVKPGLSGWAQINYGYGANVDDARIKLSYDLYYLKHASLALDMLVILRTFGAMMKGAR